MHRVCKNAQKRAFYNCSLLISSCVLSLLATGILLELPSTRTTNTHTHTHVCRLSSICCILRYTMNKRNFRRTAVHHLHHPLAPCLFRHCSVHVVGARCRLACPRFARRCSSTLLSLSLCCWLPARNVRRPFRGRFSRISRNRVAGTLRPGKVRKLQRYAIN